MVINNNIWVFSERLGTLAELIAGANELAKQTHGKVSAVVLGSRENAEQAIEMGADNIFWLGELSESQLVEDYVPTLAKLVKDSTPMCIMIGATKRGKAVAGRLAARLGTSVITDIKAFSMESGEFHGTHMIYGGGAIRIEKAKFGTTIITIGQGFFNPKPLDSTIQGNINEISMVEPEKKISLIERKKKETVSVNLASAKKVVCLGRGVSKEEDLDMFREMARLLGAEIGCTRPLSEGLGWLPRELYIGVSGVFIKPDLYISFGVSGQVQHTVGITASKVVVAIDKDENAAIFPQADYGIVADLYKIAPALIDVLRRRT
jgi:electron transfer flavoprotein alpha subunit